MTIFYMFIYFNNNILAICFYLKNMLNVYSYAYLLITI